MTINLVNILVKNCPLKTLEMLFQRIKISNFSGEHAPRSINSVLSPSAVTWYLGYKNIPILHSQKFGQSGHINKVVVWGAGVGLLYNLKITVIYPFYGVKC